MRLIAASAFFWCALFFGAPADAQTLTNKGTAVDNSGAGSSLAVTGVSVTAPTMVIVGVYEDDSSGSGGQCSFGSSKVSDGTNTYTLLTHIQPNGGNAEGDLCVYYFNYSSSGLTGATITYTYNTSSDDASVSVTAVTGYGGAAPDSAVTNTARGNNSGPATVTSGTPSVSGETFLGFSVVATSTTFTQASGWTTPPNKMSSTTGNPNTTFQSGNKLGSGTSTQTYAPTFAGTNFWGSIILGIKPSAAVSKVCTISATGAGPC